MVVRIRVLPIMALCAVLLSGVGAGGAAARSAASAPVAYSSAQGTPMATDTPAATGAATVAGVATTPVSTTPEAGTTVPASATTSATATASITGTAPAAVTAPPTSGAATAGSGAPTARAAASAPPTSASAPAPSATIIATPATVLSATATVTPTAAVTPSATTTPAVDGLGAAVAPVRAPAGAPRPGKRPDLAGRLPLGFEENRGQTDPAVAFLSRGADYAVYLSAGAATLAVVRPATSTLTRPELAPYTGPGSGAPLGPPPGGEQATLRLAFAGADAHALIEGRDRLPGTISYLRGDDASRWHTAIPTYARVAYDNLYPGVDLVYYGTDGRLEYDYIVRPNADPSPIALDVQGAQALALDSDGALVLTTAVGPVRQEPPVAYQEVDGARRAVDARYTLTGTTVGVALGAYDHSQPLTIDPVLVYGTYLGGSTGYTNNGNTYPNGIAVDAAGDAYVTGYTYATNFVTTPNAYRTTPITGADAFVSKFNPAGNALLYSTYLGGSGDDDAHHIALDASGNAYVTGWTSSTNFPVVNAAQSAYGGGQYDAFVTKLNPSGTAFVYSTYLGGSGRDMGYGIAVDASGAAYLTGRTTSTNYITTTGTLQGGLKGAEDAFVTKLTPAGAVAYSTYLGGSGQEYGANVAVDASGAAYVAGDTVSADFPTPNGAQPVAPGGYGDDGFVAELNPGGTALVYGTYLGGTNIDQALGIALDPAGNVYASGSSRYSFGPAYFPTTAGAYQTTNYGGFEAFVVELDVTRSGVASLVYGTLVGGLVDSPSSSIAVDAAGDAYITGQAITARSETDPTYSYPYLDPLQGVVGGGNSDAYVTEINPAGSALVWSVFLGGSGDDNPMGLALDASGAVYVVGATTSTDFAVSGAPQPFPFNNGADAFVSKLAPLGGGGAIPWHPHHGVSLSGTGVPVGDVADPPPPPPPPPGHADVTTSDLHIPGRGPDLALGRTWDSTVAQGGLTAGTGGWTSSLTPRVSGSVTGTVLFTDTTNAVWPFRYASYLSVPPIYRHYVTPSGLPWTLTTSTAGYTLTNFLTGAALLFDASGRLISSQDAYSNTNSMSYGAGSATSPSGEANSGGRALVFGYSNGQLTDAQSPLWQQGGAGAAGSQHVTYGYNGSGQIATRTLGAGTPDAVTTTFGYSGTQLTSITTPANRVWALGYDEQGRVSTLTSPVSGTAGQAGYTPGLHHGDQLHAGPYAGGGGAGHKRRADHDRHARRAGRGGGDGGRAGRHQ